MSVTMISSQADMDQLFAGVSQQCDRVRYRSFLRKQLAELAVQHRDWFRLARSPSGERWPKLSPRTIRRKGHATILVDTGRLQRSLTGASAGGDAIRELVDEPSGRGVGFGTSVPYSIFHDRARGGRPARRHVGTTALFVTTFAAAALDTLMGHMTAGQRG